MEIEQFRVTLRARDYETTCRFYGETLAFPRVAEWETEERVGARFQAGSGVIEVEGRRPGGRALPDDRLFEYRGPQHEMEIRLIVPSPQAAYDEIIFRQKNILGGMHALYDGAVVFETQDPDGIRIVFRASDD